MAGEHRGVNFLQKAIQFLGLSGSEGWSNRNNFETNQVTVSQWQDRGASGVDGVLALSAAWACVNLLAGTIASLPLMVYRTTRDGRRTIANDHPLYRVLHDSPNADQTSLDYWEFMGACLELQGNGYSEAERRPNGDVIALDVPFAPELVRVERLSNGPLSYEVTEREIGRAHV